MDKILENFNIDRDTMNAEELRVLDEWAEKLRVTEISLTDVKRYIDSMINVTSRELAGEDYPKSFSHYFFRKRRERNLRARLYNYILLKDFLTAPDKARSYVEKHLKNLKPKN